MTHTLLRGLHYANGIVVADEAFEVAEVDVGVEKGKGKKDMGGKSKSKSNKSSGKVM